MKMNLRRRAARAFGAAMAAMLVLSGVPALASDTAAENMASAEETSPDTSLEEASVYMTAADKTSAENTLEAGSVKPGTYTVAVDLRNNSNPEKSSMSAPVLNKEATLSVAADGVMTLSLDFPTGIQIANIDVNATNIDIFEKDGTTKMPVTLTTYTTTLYGGETGEAMTGAAITLSYESEDGLYLGYIYSDFMSAPVQLYVDFSTVARVTADETTAPDESAAPSESAAPNESTAPEETAAPSSAPETADKTKLETVMEKAAALNEADYTADSWKTLSDALAEAKSVRADADATQDETDAAMNAVTDAINALVKAADDDLTSGETKTYTPGTYSAPITMTIDAMSTSFLIDGSVVIDEDGTASMLIDFTKISEDGGTTWKSAYDTGTVYYLAFNGYSLDGTSENMTLEGADITYVDVNGTDKDGNATTYHALNTVKFPLPYLTTDENGLAQYKVSLKFYVPAMSHLTFAADGFDYVVPLTVDMSEIPVETKEDPTQNNDPTAAGDDSKTTGGTTTSGSGLSITSGGDVLTRTASAGSTTTAASGGAATGTTTGSTTGTTAKSSTGSNSSATSGTTTSARTGDPANTAVWTAALLAAAVCIAVCRKKERQ